MREFEKPVIYVSKCLGFDHCRYNGLTISDEFVDLLRGHVKFALVCPEVEIGLGVPRHPVRIVSRRGELHLMQSETGEDVTSRMIGYAEDLFRRITVVDGFILKSRSPSCGVKDVKVYPGLGKAPVVAKDSGFFGGAVQKQFPLLSVEDEGRLRNFRIREHFLTRIYAYAMFRRICEGLRMRELVEFHAQHKFLLMAYSQKALRMLGRIVANHERKPVSDVFGSYEREFKSALRNVPRYTSCINVLMHVMGYFSKAIKQDEKRFLLESFENYRAGQAPLSVPLNILRSYAIRFESEYLKNQAFFEPFPKELVLISDSGKGRKTG